MAKLMDDRPAVRPDSRAPLSRERVLQAAIDLADQSGIEGVSMRKLAQELGVEAMSLYHYFARKDELLDSMLDSVFTEFERPEPTGDWRAAMRRSAISAHHALLRHPWACQMLGEPTGPGRGRLEWMNTILGRLRTAGFSAKLTHHAYHAIDSHIIGFTLWVLPYLAIQREQPQFAANVFETLPLEGLPHLVEHIEYHVTTDEEPTDTSEFDFGMDLLLDGLERMREAHG